MSAPPAQPNQSLIDGLDVLQALASAEAPVGSRQMARQLNLEATRVNRLLKTLAHLGIAQQTPDNKYTSGPGMHVLAAQAMFGSGLVRRAIEPLESLRRFKLSVALGVLWRDHVGYLYHAGPSTRPAEAIGRTGLFPATRSSIGLVLLSRLPVGDVRALYRDRPIPGFGEGISALLATLSDIRTQGVAMTRPFDDQTTNSIAVAIEGESAAIALSGNFDNKQSSELSSALRSAAEQISQVPTRI